MRKRKLSEKSETKKSFVKMLSCALLLGVLSCGNGMDVHAAGKEAKAYSKYLTEQKKNSDFKYFAIVDINKDGVNELIGSNKTNQKAEHWINLVLYKKGEVAPYYGTSMEDVLYSHKSQKGIRIVNSTGISYETLSDDGWSSVKTIGSFKESGSTKYFYYEGDMSGESGNSKNISKSEYNNYLKQSWAFNSKSSGAKKVTFYKNNATNRKKLEQGKIK